MSERMPTELRGEPTDWDAVFPSDPLSSPEQEPQASDIAALNTEVDEEIDEAAALAQLAERSNLHLMSDPGAVPEGGIVGRRAAARLRLSLPARFIAIERTHNCILLNLSRTGALLAILHSVREGESGFLRCGKINAFAIVTRSEFGLNALQFEEEISHESVLEIRRHYENFEQRERRQLIETARQWVNGDSNDERAI